MSEMADFLGDIEPIFVAIHENLKDLKSLELCKNEITETLFEGKTMTKNYLYLTEDAFLLCRKYSVEPKHIVSVFDYYMLLNKIQMIIEDTNADYYSTAEKTIQKYYKKYGSDILKIIRKV